MCIRDSLGAGELSGDLWDVDPQSFVVAEAAAAIPMSLAHTLELNAGTLESGVGPCLQANWSWAQSALTADEVGRLSQLWFDALTGICALVGRGGGGLTPSDIVPARLTQSQIDDLDRRYGVADILPLTPLQQGLLFHTVLTDGVDGGLEDLYSVQLDVGFAGNLDTGRLRDAVQAVIGRHPNLAARFVDEFGQPVQVIPVCLLYTSPSPRDRTRSRLASSS